MKCLWFIRLILYPSYNYVCFKRKQLLLTFRSGIALWHQSLVIVIRSAYPESWGGSEGFFSVYVGIWETICYILEKFSLKVAEIVKGFAQRFINPYLLGYFSCVKCWGPGSVRLCCVCILTKHERHLPHAWMVEILSPKVSTSVQDSRGDAEDQKHRKIVTQVALRQANHGMAWNLSVCFSERIRDSKYSFSGLRRYYIFIVIVVVVAAVVSVISISLEYKFTEKFLKMKFYVPFLCCIIIIIRKICNLFLTCKCWTLK